MQILATERLLLRTWQDADLAPMLAINQDPQVMQYLPGLRDLAMTKQFIDTVNRHFAEQGFTRYATVSKATGAFIGFIGLLQVPFTAPFTPAVEIGWRLSATYWGQGLATEGASAVLEYAFRVLKKPEIVSFTAVGNMKSRRVMEKIGLQHHELDDFDHPKLADNSPLKRQVLYRLSRAHYFTQQARSQ